MGPYQVKESEQMKRFLVLLLMVFLLVSFTGCSVLDYKEATELYNAGAYAEALEIYRALGDFADSARMAELCWQKVDYAAAETALAAGDYTGAMTLYQGLGMYRDSPAKAITSQYLAGADALVAGDYAEAIDLLEPLGSYENSREKIDEAKWLWLHSHGELLTGSAEERVSLLAQPDGSFALIYNLQGFVLGAPYQGNVTLTLRRGQHTADFTAFYESTSATTIREEAVGTLELVTFTGSTPLPVNSFLQTVTDQDGVQTQSTDPSAVLMIRTVLTQSASKLAQALPELLNASGVPITAHDLGFFALKQEESI